MSSGLIKKNNNLVTQTNGLVKKSSGLTTRSTDQIAKPDTVFAESTLKAGAKSIGFIFDRTASREDTWAQAKVEQEKLLQKGAELKTRLVHFGGNDIGDTGWHLSPRPLIEEMHKVNCKAGNTQIVQSLERFLRPDEAPALVMLVGDSFEENMSDIVPVAKKMLLNGSRVFAFQEGNDSDAKNAFQTLADITKGAYLKLGDDANVNLGDATEAAITWMKEGDAGLKRLAEAGSKAALGVATSMKLLGN